MFYTDLNKLYFILRKMNMSLRNIIAICHSYHVFLCADSKTVILVNMKSLQHKAFHT